MSNASHRNPEKIYNNQILPQLNKLLRRCKHYDIPILVAAAIPFGDGKGVTMTQFQLDKEERAPANLVAAWQALQPEAQTANAEPASTATGAGSDIAPAGDPATTVAAG